MSSCCDSARSSATIGSLLDLKAAFVGVEDEGLSVKARVKFEKLNQFRGRSSGPVVTYSSRDLKAAKKIV